MTTPGNRPLRSPFREDPGLRRWIPLGVLVLLAILPYSTVDIPWVFDGPLNSPGTLQVLAICLVFGGLALGYDLLFGRTGLLSFGHALYFAAGVYGTSILVNVWPLWLAGLVAPPGPACSPSSWARSPYVPTASPSPW
jgi:branched-chain amino acid transport system permease protein